MFGINLTTVQKVEVALVFVILGLAGFFFLRSFGPTFDHTVKTYVLTTRQHPINDNPAHDGRVTMTNPRDPKKDETVIVFACADGKLEISQYLNDPLRHPTLKWLPETRQPGLVYQYYQNPLAPVEDIKDPFRRALAYATYNKVYGVKALGLLASAAMSEAQVPQEAAARKQLDNETSIIDAECESGTYHPEMMDQVMKSLDAYNAQPGDPERDTAKASLAHKVLDAAAVYTKQVQDEKDKAIDKYMAVIDQLLTADQKQKVIDAYKAATHPAGRGTPAGRRGAAGAGTGARGGAVTRGGAGTRNGTATRGGAVTRSGAVTRGGAATRGTAATGGARGGTVPATGIARGTAATAGG